MQLWNLVLEFQFGRVLGSAHERLEREMMQAGQQAHQTLQHLFELLFALGVRW
jgi:hypothetical protein